MTPFGLDTPSVEETSTKPIRIGLFAGDGRAREVAPWAKRILQAIRQNRFQVEDQPYDADYHVQHGRPWPDDAPSQLQANYDGFLLTAFGDNRIKDMGHAREILINFLRGSVANTGPSLCTNYNLRPTHLLHPDLALIPTPVGKQFHIHPLESSAVTITETVSDKGSQNETVTVHEAHHKKTYLDSIEEVAKVAWRAGERIAVGLKPNVYTYAHLPIELAVNERYQDYNKLYREKYGSPFIRVYNADALAYEMLHHPESMPRHIIGDPILMSALHLGINSIGNDNRATTPENFQLELGRENISGQYIGVGRFEHENTQDQIGIQTALHSRPLIDANISEGARRAVALKQTEVTVLYIANGSNIDPSTKERIGMYPKTLDLMRRVASEVQSRYCVLVNFMPLDEFYDLASRDPIFLNNRVFVGDNLVGDIGSDGISVHGGGLGCAASISYTTEELLHTRKRSIFGEPVHGTAPTLPADTINPTGMIETTGLLLEQFSFGLEAKLLREAVIATIDDGIRTMDMPRSNKHRREVATTSVFGNEVLRRFTAAI